MINTKQLTSTAGILYVLIIIFGLIAQVFVRDRLVDYSNASITAKNILAAESWYRFGFVSELAMLVCDIGVTSILFILFKETSKFFSFLSTAFRLASIIILAITALSHYAALMLLNGSDYLTALDSSQLNAMALFSIKLHGIGYNLSLLFFGVHLLILSYLLIQSVLFHNYLGILIFIGGVSYIINSIIWFQFPNLVRFVYPAILLPSAAGEWIFSIYLIAKGVRKVREPSLQYRP